MINSIRVKNSNLFIESVISFHFVNLFSDIAPWLFFKRCDILPITRHCLKLGLETQEHETRDPETRDPETRDPGTRDSGTPDPGPLRLGTLGLGTCYPGTWDPDTQDPGNGTLGPCD